MRKLFGVVAVVVALAAMPAAAVLTGTTSRVDYVASGSSTVFSFDFKVYETAAVEVFLSGVKQTSGYTVALNAAQSPAGGSVTFLAAPGSGVAVRIQRTLPLTQDMVLGAHSPFPAKTVEKQHDRATMVAQQLKRQLDEVVLEAGTPDVPCNDAGNCSVGLTAPTFTGDLVGNASTATALAANPTDCAAGQYATSIAATGNLTCGAVAGSEVSGAIGIHGSVAEDVPSIPAHSWYATAFAVSGALPGSPCVVGTNLSTPSKLITYCYVNSSGNVQIVVVNPMDVAVDPPSLVYRAVVFNP